MINLTNKCEFGIVQFSYKPKKISDIEEQQKEFVKMVQIWVNKNPDKYPSWFLNEFVSKNPEKGYWNVVPDSNTKTNYFLLPKKMKDKWSMGGRLAYAKRTIYRNDPRWKEEPQKPVNVYPGSFYRHKPTTGNEPLPISQITKKLF